MSNGISALKGFDYQATVILDRLFDHFDHNGAGARARPEGDDDLDLSWIESAVEHRRYEQIKKPREDNQGNRTPRAWTLSDVCDELLPNTITNLSGNAHEQVWIVGDEVTEEVGAVLGSQSDASFVNAYSRALHLLARDDVIDTSGLDNALRRQLLRWQPPTNLSADLAGVLRVMTQSFTEHVKTIGAPDDVVDRYRAKATELNVDLPGILARTKILPLYGTEHEVVKRVHDRLEQRYGLQRSIIENTLFRNLRGFINDISKQPGRRFDQAEFEMVNFPTELAERTIRSVANRVSHFVSTPDIRVFTTDRCGPFLGGLPVFLCNHVGSPMFVRGDNFAPRFVASVSIVAGNEHDSPPAAHCERREQPATLFLLAVRISFASVVQQANVNLHTGYSRTLVAMISKGDAIRILNDHLRTTFTGGRILVTTSIAELDCERKTRVLVAVREFNDFGPDNDPYHEHDVAFFDIDGERYFFKVDYYDLTESYHSPDPADPELTHRVLTIGHHSEY